MKWFDHIIHTSERLNKIRSTQPCFPPVSLNRVPSSAGGKGGNVTSAGWQVIPYSMWVPVAITLVVNLQTAIYSIYLLTFIMIIYQISWFYRTTLCQCGICCRRVASVRPSVTSRYCIETMDESNWLLAWRLPSTCPTLCYKTWGSAKIRSLPSGTLPQTPDLENFATASRSRCQQNSSSSSSSSSTVEFVHDTYTIID